MARIHKQRVASLGAAATRHNKTETKKPYYKVVFEEVSEKKRLKSSLSFDAKAPKGYTFIPAGDPQLTNRCKKIAREDGMTVFIVSTSNPRHPELSHETNRVGYHFPSVVVEKACQSLGVTLTQSGRVVQSNFALLDDKIPNSTLSKRKGARRKPKTKGRKVSPKFDISLSQATIDTQAREAIKDLFPKIPQADLHEIISRAFQKGRNLVGTSSDQSLVRRAQLAVVAHIRHMHTHYDQMLKVVPWAEARRRVERHTLDRLVSWRGDDDDDANVMEDVLREVIVISDDEEEEEDEEEEDDEGLDSHDSVVSRKLFPRNPNVEFVSSEDLQTQPLNLANDEYLESEDDSSVQYLGLAQLPSRQHQPFNQHKEDRLGAHRHRRWEEALDRRRKDPGLLNVQDHNKYPLEAKDRPDDTSLQGQVQYRDLYRANNPRQDFRPTDNVASLNHMYTRLIQLPDPDVRMQSTADLERDGNNLRSDQYDSRQQMIQTSQQHRALPTQRPGEPSQAYHSVDNTFRPNYYHEGPNRQLPSTAQFESTRFVETQNPFREVNDSFYPPISEPLPRRHSDRVLPSIEDDACAMRSQQDGSTTGPTRKAARSIVRLNGHEQLASFKRPRVDGFMDVCKERTREPHDSYGHGRTILIPIEPVPNRSAPRQRPFRLTNDGEPRAIEPDPRIVMLSPRDPERYPDTGTEPQPIVQPGRGPNRPPLVVDYERTGTLPPKHIHLSTSRAQRGDLSQVSLLDSQVLRSFDSSSHYSRDASRFPTAHEMTDSHFLRCDNGATAVNGRVVNSGAANRKLLRFDRARRGDQSQVREMALDPVSHQSHAMDFDEDFTPKRLVQNNPQATSFETYSYARPRRYANPTEPDQRGLRPIEYNTNNYRHLPEQQQKTWPRSEHDTYSAPKIQRHADMDTRNSFDRDPILNMTRPVDHSRLQNINVHYKENQGIPDARTWENPSNMRTENRPLDRDAGPDYAENAKIIAPNHLDPHSWRKGGPRDVIVLE